MGYFLRGLACALVTSLAAGVACAAEADPACPAEAARLPPPLAGWSASQPIVAASAPGQLGRATLALGRAADAQLTPTDRLAYAARPGKPSDRASFGGMLRVTIARAGTYRVALGNAAWVDLVGGGVALASVAHGHGPACSGIRKVVDFAVKPGAYTVQIAASDAPVTRVMVVPLP